MTIVMMMMWAINFHTIIAVFVTRDSGNSV